MIERKLFVLRCLVCRATQAYPQAPAQIPDNCWNCDSRQLVSDHIVGEGLNPMPLWGKHLPEGQQPCRWSRKA